MASPKIEERAMRRRVVWLTGGLALALCCLGLLRRATLHPGPLTPLAGYITPGYVLVTVVFAVRLVRTGLPLNRWGFGTRPEARQIVLALVAILMLRVLALVVAPMLEEVLGQPRDLQRFSDVEGSPAALGALLLLNWTFAAFGEELAYRIVLMRGIAFALGDGRIALISAVVLQAVLFGVAHAYQGPTGMLGSCMTGLVLGAVTILGRWSIWPAALAHGVNNTIGILELYRG